MGSKKLPAIPPISTFSDAVIEEAVLQLRLEAAAIVASVSSSAAEIDQTSKNISNAAASSLESASASTGALHVQRS